MCEHCLERNLQISVLILREKNNKSDINVPFRKQEKEMQNEPQVNRKKKI